MVVGCIFVVSGFEKIITPYQNFQYVIESYQVVPDSWEAIIAQVFPWVELITGLFVMLGLWTKTFLFSALGMSTTFMIIVSQAIIRQLPITECGCFGELVSLPLQAVLTIDATLFCCTLFLIKNYPKTTILSLDQHFHEPD